MIARLVHPGPVALHRTRAVPCRARLIQTILPQRDSLLASVADAMAGQDGAWLWLHDVPMAGLAFLIPGLDPTGAHAAWYAGPHVMPPGARIVTLGLHLGWQDGAPFLHGHGLFDAPGWDGPRAGHVLADRSRLAGPAPAHGYALRGARLVRRPDPETAFDLFVPEPCDPDPQGRGRPAVLMTARPNQDLCAAVESVAAAHGLAASAAVAGLGSLVAPVFDDGSRVDSPATEILLRNGQIRHGRADLGAHVVGLDGQPATGGLLRGACGICVTAEILICARSA